MKVEFRYKTHKETEIVLPVWDFRVNNWKDTEPVVLRKTLLGAMHPGVEMCIGEVPTISEIESNQRNGSDESQDMYIERMKKGIPFYLNKEEIREWRNNGYDINGLSPETYKKARRMFTLDISGGARTHGRGIYTMRDVNIGELYFGRDNTMGFVNYGSILLTECRKIISGNLDILIVDDEEEDMRAAGLGDSHGKCTQEILTKLSRGVARQRGEGEPNTPLQIRVGFPNEFMFKGTVVSFPNDEQHENITNRYGGQWDLILPISGIKGNKPAVGSKLVRKTCYVGNVHFAEEREAIASQQFWMWYTPKAIQYDILPKLEEECEVLGEGVRNRLHIANQFTSIERMRADMGYTGEIDPESWEADDDGASPVGDEETKDGFDGEYVDPVIEILAADKFGALLEHPWMTNKIIERLSRRWRRYALNTHVLMKSYMAMPDDTIPYGSFVCGSLPTGYHIVFRNPILHHGSIKILYNINDGSYPHYQEQRGTMFMSHKTAADSQGDFDGDYFSVVPLDEDQQEFAEELMDIDPAFMPGEFNEYITEENNIYGEDSFKHIIFETVFNQYLWGENPPITKPDKVRITGSVEEVFYRSMDSLTGIVSNMIQHSKSNMTYNNEVLIPDFNWQTNEYSGEYTPKTIISFLSQEMQIAVDRLKNNLYHNMQGIEICREVIDKGDKPKWLHDRNYKDNNAYKKQIIPIGQVKKVVNPETGRTSWIDLGTNAHPDDVVSLTISVVNNYWVEWSSQKNHVSQFKTFFPQDYDGIMKQYTDKIHIWYGKAMTEAASIGKKNPGTPYESDPEPWKYVDARKKAMRVVRSQADDIRSLLNNLESILSEEIKSRGTEILGKMWNMNDRNLVNEVFGGVVTENPTGVMKHDDGSYSVATAYNWACAFWHSANSPGAQEKSLGGSVFKLYSDEIVKRLGAATDLNVTTWFNGDKYKMGDYIFGSGNSQGDYERHDSNSKFPVRAIPRENSRTIFMPSRVDNNGRLLPTTSQDGTKIPNVVQCIIYREGVNRGREASPKFVIYVRSREDRPWQPLGVVSSSREVPPLNTLLEVSLHTFKLTNPEPLQKKENIGIVAMRTKGGIMEWRRAE
jgi:hypothetical protein